MEIRGINLTERRDIRLAEGKRLIRVGMKNSTAQIAVFLLMILAMAERGDLNPSRSGNLVLQGNLPPSPLLSRACDSLR
jgi:hypothetical protein